MSVYLSLDLDVVNGFSFLEEVKSSFFATHFLKETLFCTVAFKVWYNMRHISSQSKDIKTLDEFPLVMRFLISRLFGTPSDDWPLKRKKTTFIFGTRRSEGAFYPFPVYKGKKWNWKKSWWCPEIEEIETITTKIGNADKNRISSRDNFLSP